MLPHGSARAVATARVPRYIRFPRHCSCLKVVEDTLVLSTASRAEARQRRMKSHPETAAAATEPAKRFQRLATAAFKATVIDPNNKMPSAEAIKSLRNSARILCSFSVPKVLATGPHEPGGRQRE